MIASAASRQVQRLHLRAPDDTLAGRGVRLIEDALRTASLPDAGAGMLLFRRLALGRFGADVAPQTLSLALERRVAALRGLAVHAAAPGAAQSPAVWFRDALEAHSLLALRIAEGEPAHEWFWPLVVPELQPAGSAAQRLRAVVHSLRRRAEAPIALPLLGRALAQRGHADTAARGGRCRADGQAAAYPHDGGRAATAPTPAADVTLPTAIAPKDADAPPSRSRRPIAPVPAAASTIAAPSAGPTAARAAQELAGSRTHRPIGSACRATSGKPCARCGHLGATSRTRQLYSRQHAPSPAGAAQHRARRRAARIGDACSRACTSRAARVDDAGSRARTSRASAGERQARSAAMARRGADRGRGPVVPAARAGSARLRTVARGFAAMGAARHRPPHAGARVRAPRAAAARSGVAALRRARVTVARSDSALRRRGTKASRRAAPPGGVMRPPTARGCGTPAAACCSRRGRAGAVPPRSRRCCAAGASCDATSRRATPI